MESSTFRRNAVAYMFLLPWLLGLFAFVVGPMISSLYLSFTKYDIVSPAQWIGIANFKEIFGQDMRFLKALKATFIFVFTSVPLKLAFALFVAILLNRSIRSIGLYRSVFYLPSLLGGSVAIAVVWKRIFSQDGFVNTVLGWFHIEGQIWIASPTFAIYTIVILAVWQFGSPMIIFLAGLKQIPEHLYEASSIDGATKRQQFLKITLPMLSPVIFFNLVLQTINGFMVFTQGYIITKGGPLDSTLLYTIYLYEKGFKFFQMGYASALSWILLVIVGVFTAIIFMTSKHWIYYESEGGAAK
ncbi:sugar ABC transporter permease [Paenibacillus sp. J5C_2022]|uniref:carbohydrate ABC transporter permease n=1 Tax=Paenibacillus sp. J5C2022 TaxID=2977129 RepID=UPI0021D288C8|nr:sugar ABC transporter permease [Paenibacillus sp. J5C2022]MCU6707361.1 sugar ABC transporter permease [Paenibacillus sp. J5C2022]